jgi:hypothetical protein
MPQTATHGATRITPRAYLTYCQSQLDAAILDREELLNQLGLAHSQCRHWGANTAEAQAELEAEESAQLLAEALGVRRSGPLVEFDDDIGPSPAPITWAEACEGDRVEGMAL